SVTIKDLAAELDLSITTISRALNGYADVGEKTRTKVQDAALRMGYRPHRNAQRLVLQRTHNIASVQCAHELKYLNRLLAGGIAGVSTRAREVRSGIPHATHAVGREVATYDRYVYDYSVDGSILDLRQEDNEPITILLQARRPFVLPDRERWAASYG